MAIDAGSFTDVANFIGKPYLQRVPYVIRILHLSAVSTSVRNNGASRSA